MKIFVYLFAVFCLIASCEEIPQKKESSLVKPPASILSDKESMAIQSAKSSSEDLRSHSIIKENLKSKWKCEELFKEDYFESFNKITKEDADRFFNLDSLSASKPIDMHTESAHKIDEQSILIIINVSFIGVCSNYYAFAIDCEMDDTNAYYLYSDCDQEVGSYPIKTYEHKIDIFNKRILVDTEYVYERDSIRKERVLTHF